MTHHQQYLEDVDTIEIVAGSEEELNAMRNLMVNTIKQSHLNSLKCSIESLNESKQIHELESSKPQEVLGEEIKYLQEQYSLIEKEV